MSIDDLIKIRKRGLKPESVCVSLVAGVSESITDHDGDFGIFRGLDVVLAATGISIRKLLAMINRLKTNGVKNLVLWSPRNNRRIVVLENYIVNIREVTHWNKIDTLEMPF